MRRIGSILRRFMRRWRRAPPAGPPRLTGAGARLVGVHMAAADQRRKRGRKWL